MLIARFIAIFSVVAILFPDSMAASQDDWSNLNLLRAGDKVGVIQSGGKRIEGRLEQVTESGITLRADHEVTVPKPEVVRVYSQHGLSRTAKVLIGAAAGVAAGAILTGTVGARFTNEGQDAPAAAWIAGGAGLGAGIGALTGGNYKTIYRRSAP